MKQQINLLDILPQKERVRFPVHVLIKIFILFIVAIAVMYGLGFYQINNLNNGLSILKAQEKTATSQLAFLKKAIADAEKDPVIKQKIADLQQQVKLRQTLVDRLAKMQVSRQWTFSEILSTLNRGSLRGAWLQEISVGPQGDVALSGGAVSSKAALAFLNKLNSVGLFKLHPLKLGALNEKNTDKSANVTFQFGGYL